MLWISETGASVISVQRAEGPIGSPGADFHVQTGDVLVLTGTVAAVDRALLYLVEGPREAGMASDPPAATGGEP